MSMLKWVFLFKGSGETPGRRIQHWMISLEEHIICKGIQPAFLSGLAAVFSTYNNFNLQYQAEDACTLEFIQRLDTWMHTFNSLHILFVYHFLQYIYF